MKKIIVLFGIMALALGITACTSKDEASEETEEIVVSDSADVVTEVAEDEGMEAEYTKFEDEESFPGVYTANETGSFIILTGDYEGFVDWTDTEVIEEYRGPITWEAGKIFLTNKDNKEINYAIYMHSHNADEYSMLIRNDDKSVEIRFQTAYDELPQDLADEIRAEGYDKYLENLYIY